MIINDRNIDSQQVEKEIIKVLDENKGQDIVSIDLAGKSGIFDYMIVVSTNSSRHMHSLAEKVSLMMKYSYQLSITIEGDHKSDWLVLDLGDIIVHIFKPEARAHYNLEELWVETFSQSHNEKISSASL